MTVRAYLFNKSDEELDNPTQGRLFQIPFRTKQTEHVDKVIVHGIVLGGQLSEEHASQVGNLLVLVF